jgi:hypothetical protein
MDGFGEVTKAPEIIRSDSLGDAVKSPYPDAVSVHRPSGFILQDGQTVADTLMCVHCGTHWVPRKGSGIVRGWCMSCSGPVCGPRCRVCVPMEKMLDLAEKAGHR